MKHTEQDAKRILEKEQILGLASNQPGLRKVRPFYYGLKNAPIDIVETTPEGVVFFNLQVCYQNQHNVSEGTVEDVIWGFRQSGIPNNITWEGFKTLKKLGYLTFTDNTGVVLFGDPNARMWYKWTPKYFELLLSGPTLRGKIEDKVMKEVDKKIIGKDTTMDKVE